MRIKRITKEPSITSRKHSSGVIAVAAGAFISPLERRFCSLVRLQDPGLFFPNCRYTNTTLYDLDVVKIL